MSGPLTPRPAAPQECTRLRRLPLSLDENARERPLPATPQALDRFLKAWEESLRHPRLLWDPFSMPAEQSLLARFFSTQSGAGSFSAHPLTLPETSAKPLPLNALLEMSGWDCRLARAAGLVWGLPWLDCGVAAGGDHAAMKTWLREQSAALRGTAEAGACGFQDNLEQARRLFLALLAPAEHGGFGLDFDWDPSGPHRDFGAIFREHRATCAEFVALFLYACASLGLEARAVAVFAASSGTVQEHLMAGLIDPDSGKIVAVADHYRSYFGPPDPDGSLWKTLSPVDFLIYLENLRGARDPNAAAGEARIDRILALKPDHYLSLYNKAYFVGKRGDYVTALDHLFSSLADYPLYTPTYQNLAYFAQESQNPFLKNWALESWENLKGEAETGFPASAP